MGVVGQFAQRSQLGGSLNVETLFQGVVGDYQILPQCRQGCATAAFPACRSVNNRTAKPLVEGVNQQPGTLVGYAQ